MSNRTYILSVVIREGNDEFWESIGPKASGRHIVEQEVRCCLADHGFFSPGTEVRLIAMVRAEEQP